MKKHVIALIVAWLGLLAGPSFAGEKAVLDSLRSGGHVLLLRHAATESGVGDPPGYRLDDCRTQRNLSAEGRADARRLGEVLRAQGVQNFVTLTSPWCRCRETARLAFGQSEDWEALGSFFDDYSLEPSRTAQVKQRIAGFAGSQGKGTLVLVTHQVNITALTGITVSMGEAVVLNAFDRSIVGRLRF